MPKRSKASGLCYDYYIVNLNENKIIGYGGQHLHLKVDYFTTKLVKSLQFEYSPLFLPSCPRSTLST